MKWGLGCVVGAVVAGLAFVPGAGASGTLYATASGGAVTGTCPLSAPCTFAYAMTQVGSAGTVQLLPGTYQIPDPGETCGNVSSNGLQYGFATVEGVPGRPRPILQSGPTCARITLGIGAVLRDVTIQGPPQSANAQTSTVNLNGGGILDGLIDEDALGVLDTGPGVVENTAVGGIVFTGTGGVAINDTAQQIIVEGYQQNSQNINASATVVNSIVRVHNGIQAFNFNADGPGTPTTTATLNVSYYVGDTSTTPPPTGGQFGTTDGQITQSHQIGPSSMTLNLASDGIHETASSPTIDQGTNSPSAGNLPTDDFDGGVRSAGNAPDVGADEFGTGLPILNTLAATNVTYKSATLHGTIDTNEVDNPSVRFLYGKGSALTFQTAAHDAPAGVTNAPQQVTVTGLSPSTTYSFVIESGSQQAQVVTFHTAKAPPPPNPFKGVVFEQHTAQASRQRVVALQLFCPTNTLGFCQGTLTLSSGRTVLGSHAFLTNHGNLFTVKITLTQTAFNQLVRKRTETVLATAVAHDSHGNRKTTTASITLKAPPKR